MTLRRESDGNIVLTSGDMELRFFRNYGGTPLEWWKRNYPGPLTNSFPGSGAGVNCETGQDPTQGSCDGITPNPICIVGDTTTERYNYYCRESLVDMAGVYEVSGFLPIFWLGAEPIDNYLCPDTASAWSYRAADAALIFNGTSAQWSGIIAPANEIETGQIARIPHGRMAFKVTIAMTSPQAIAGVFFRKTALPNQPTKDQFYIADGYHLNVSWSGRLELVRAATGSQVLLAAWTLAPSAITLLHTTGLELELRTNNVLTGQMQVYANDILLRQVIDPAPILGDGFGLFAQTTSGSITFTRRQVFDLGVTFRSRYISKDSAPGIITASYDITSLEPRPFYRANLPAVFLSRALYSPRTCQIKTDTWIEGEGLHGIKDYNGYWCGSEDGGYGICMKNASATVDGLTSLGAHLLMQRHGVHDEFIMHLNPFAAFEKTVATSARMSVEWSTQRV